MTRLLEKADELDGIVVETSGLALPEPLVAAFGWPEIRARTRVHAVVTVVDGEALAAGHVVGDASALEAQRQADPSLDHIRAIEDLFDDQLRAADLVLVSRADALDAGELERVITALRPQVRPGTTLLPMSRGQVDPALLLGGGNHGDAVSGSGLIQPSSLAGLEPVAAAGDHDDDHHGHGHGDDHDDHHDHSHVAMHAVVVRRSGHWDRQDLERRLRQLIREQPVLRLKGRLNLEGRALPLQIQAVGPRLECWFEGASLEASSSAAPGLELVVLGAAADAERLERACAAL
jgi:cobalamin biosynthesis protein CobW